MEAKNWMTEMGVALLVLAGRIRSLVLPGMERLGRRLPQLRPATERTRGDVPGWVLITLMSAILVAGLLAIAGPALERLFNQAMDQVVP